MSSSIKTVVAGFHAGKQLLTNAGHYPTLAECISEMVQNALDANARRVEIVINTKHRLVTVQDSGNGVSRDAFEDKLRHISTSTKAAGKFGQHGLGFFAALGKCEEYVFTTCSKSDAKGVYTQYAFNTEKIRNQAEVRIPEIPLPKFIFEGKLLGADPSSVRGLTSVWWRSSVEMTDVSKALFAKFSNESLCEDLATKYGEVIRENKVQVAITFTNSEGSISKKDVRLAEFTGTKLPSWTRVYEEVGEVTVELHLALNTARGRKGKISFKEKDNPFLLSGELFAKSVSGQLEQKYIALLTSGIFEGKISGEKLKIHGDRRGFQLDDAFIGFLVGIMVWCDEHGLQYAEEAREKDKDSRIQQIGLRVMRFAELLIERSGYSNLLAQIQIGTVGVNHSKIKGAKPDSVRSLVAPPTSEGRSDKEEPNASGHTGGEERSSHRPMTVAGSRGRIRSIVKGGSTGLRLHAVEFDEIRTPFEFIIKTGTILINTRHPDWAKCESKDDWLIEYHCLVVQTAFDLEKVKAQNDFIAIQEYAFAHLSTQVFRVINGSAVLN